MVLQIRDTLQFFVGFALAIAVVVVGVVAYFELVNLLFGVTP
ncbi:hypothetical protein [Natrialba swarupiae]|nr:hypothetical protein [Natrialba swarupiae]